VIEEGVQLGEFQLDEGDGGLNLWLLGGEGHVELGHRHLQHGDSLITLLLGGGELGDAVVDEGFMDGEALLHLGPHHLDLFSYLLQHLLHEEFGVWFHGARSLLEAGVVAVRIQIGVA
jgi:hypothetical protein